MQELVYLNGKFVPHEQAVVPIEDRGNVFADGVYEVVRFYGGHPLAMEPHMERLERSAKEIRLPALDLKELTRRGLELAEKNGIDDGTLYVQVTRGAAKRNHAFPEPESDPTVFMMARPAPRPDAQLVQQGVTAITRPDIRWTRCDIKSISLLPNVLAKQEARDRDAFEAIFVRDGFVTEGSSTNVFAVYDGALRTHPKGPYILSGITRDLIITLARQEGIAVVEESISVDRLTDAQELFVSSTTAEVMPVVTVDDRSIGDGRPGPVTRRLFGAYDRLVEAVRAGHPVDSAI